MSKLLISIILFFFIGCSTSNSKKIPEIKEIDIESILNSPMSLDKHVLETCYNLNTSLAPIYLNDIMTHLNNKTGLWKECYFYTMSIYCNSLTNEQEPQFQAALFEYFLHNPAQYLSFLDKTTFETSDCLLSKLSAYVNNHVLNDEITLISIKNVVYNHCSDCSDHDIEAIYLYLDLVNKFQDK